VRSIRRNLITAGQILGNVPAAFTHAAAERDRQAGYSRTAVGTIPLRLENICTKVSAPEGEIWTCSSRRRMGSSLLPEVPQQGLTRTSRPPYRLQPRDELVVRSRSRTKLAAVARDHVSVRARRPATEILPPRDMP
jgi:hypothetical protein